MMYLYTFVTVFVYADIHTFGFYKKKNFGSNSSIQLKYATASINTDIPSVVVMLVEHLVSTLPCDVLFPCLSHIGATLYV